MGELADLREGQIPAIQEQGVARVLRAVIHDTDPRHGRQDIRQLVVALPRIPAEHVRDENLVEAISIEISKVQAHGEKGRGANRDPAQRPEATGAISQDAGTLPVVGAQ